MPITAVHAEPSVTFQTKEFNVRNEALGPEDHRMSVEFALGHELVMFSS